MFKGYVCMSGKKPLTKIKDNEKLLEIDKVRDIGVDYGGVLKNEIIMVDIDNYEEAQLLYKIVMDLGLRCNILKTTRGLHFYFLNTDVKTNAIGITCALGITVDIKLGDKNTVVPLKFDGVERVFLQTMDDLENLPCWLKPIRKSRKLNDSNTRNADLFSYILPLQTEGFSTGEIRETIEIINKYILKESLGERELEVILRDEAFSKPVFFVKGQFLHHEFAKWMMKEYTVTNISGCLYRYKDDRYEMIEDVCKLMLNEIPNLRNNQRQEVKSYIKDYLPYPKIEASYKYISVGNGILDLENMTLIPKSSDIILLNNIPTSYRKDAYSAICDQTLDKLASGDSDIRMLMEEMIGYCLFRRNELGKFFMLTGEGGRGKSTYITMIERLIGENNISSLALNQLDEKFTNTAIVGKLVNLGDDIDDGCIQFTGNLKKFTTGEKVTLQFKNQGEFSYKNYSKLIFSANKVPKIKDNTEGMGRRIIIVPFTNKFINKDYDPFIIDKLTSVESLEYLLRIAVEGLKRVISRNGFTLGDKVKNEQSKFAEYNNTVVGFMNEDGKVENELTSDAYMAYCIWCSENGLKSMSKPNFSKELSSKYNIHTKVIFIENKSTRMYLKESNEIT